MSKNSFLGFGKVDELGTINGFRKLMEMYIPNVVEDDKWFTVCHKIDASQIDLMKITGNDGKTLGNVIGEEFVEGSYRNKIYKYMLMNFMCYVEIPSVSYRTDAGAYKETFDKMLVTANIDVVASWLGLDVNKLPDKYPARLFSITMDDGDDELPVIKLTESKEGKRGATCPKKDIDVSAKGCRVVPVFMLKVGVDALYNKFKDDIVKVSFLKDNGQVRDIFTTVNFPKIKEIYGGGEFYDNCVMFSYDGDFTKNKAINRGYIRVPEIGGSRYDGATRSVNYARIINIDYNEEPDLSFINIDLGTVLEGFQDGVMEHQKDSEAIVDMLEAFDIDGGCWKDSAEKKAKYPVKDLTSLIAWSDERSLLLSTVFLRDLCLFMLGNPQWFGDFTGEPKTSSLGGFGSFGGGDFGLA